MAKAKAKAARMTAAAARRMRELDTAVARIGRLRAAGAESFDELWEEVAGVMEGDVPLWRARYRSVRDFVARELPGETVRSVARNVLVARSFSPAEEARHRLGFLEEVALYARDLAGASEIPRAINLDRLAVHVRVGTRTKRVPARQATIEMVRRARRELAAGGRRGVKESPTLAALRKALARYPALRRVALRATALELSFGAVPIAALADLARALRAVKLPPPSSSADRAK